MLKILPKYLNFETVPKKCISVPGPLDKIQKNHIYRTKQYQIFYRKIKCDLLNFRGVKEVAKLIKSFMHDKLQSRKKNCFDFLT